MTHEARRLRLLAIHESIRQEMDAHPWERAEPCTGLMSDRAYERRPRVDWGKA